MCYQKAGPWLKPTRHGGAANRFGRPPHFVEDKMPKNQKNTGRNNGRGKPFTGTPKQRRWKEIVGGGIGRRRRRKTPR